MNKKKLIIVFAFICVLSVVLAAFGACEPAEASLKVTVLKSATVTANDDLEAIKQCIKVEYVKPNGEQFEVVDYVLKGVVKSGECEFTAVFGIVSATFTIDVTIFDQKLDGSEGLKFVLKDDETYEVDDIGSCKDRDVVVPSKYKGRKVTGIAKNAFKDCVDITSVIVDSGVKSIGEFAFSGCSRIKTVTLPQSVSQIDGSAFLGCSILEKVYYKGDIADWCKMTFVNGSSNPMLYSEKFFFGEDELTGTLGIPSTVTSVGDYAFAGCRNVDSVIIAEGVKEIGVSSFSWMPDVLSIVMANNVEKIGDRAFEGCAELNSMQFSAETPKMNIGESVLENCKKLKYLSVNFIGSDKLQHVADNAHLGYFFGSSGKTYNISYIPQSLQTVAVTGETQVGDNAFYYAQNVVSVTYAGKITAVGNYAFYGCGALQSVTRFGEDLSVMKDALQEVESIGNQAFYNCAKFDLAEIPSTVQSIGDYAFEGSGITKIEINNSISVLSRGIFSNCAKLTKVVLPDSITQVGARAFQNCTLLTEISLPKGVTSIGEFAMCSGILDIRYGGSMAQWRQIRFAESWNGNSWSDSHPQRVVCSDGTITL